MKGFDNSQNGYYKYVVIVLLVVLLILTAFLVITLWERSQAEYPVIDPNDPVIEYDGTKYERNKYIETFLVLGLDKADDIPDMDSYNNDKQADFLMLFILDNEKKTCSAISINRDTMVDINVLGVAGNRIDTVTGQVALAHTYGNGREVSCRNTSDAVSSLLFGMKINHYISVTMDAVPVYNDLIGGVEVEILDDFSGIDDALIKGEKINLTGAQALTYVKTRAGLEDSTNINRMKRQRQYMNAVREKSLALAQTDDQFIVRSTLTMTDYMVSDRTVTQLQELLKKFASYEFTEIHDIQGESKVGEKFMEFHADEKSVEKLVIDLFYIPKE